MTLQKIYHEIVFGNTLDLAYEIQVETENEGLIIPDFTGFTAESHWKRNPNNKITDAIFTTADGSIDPLDDSGIVRLRKPQTIWQNLKPGKYHYVIDLTSPVGVRETYVLGEVQILESTITVWSTK